jgi:oligoribonuclease (3'-5' exoribonuclease)
MKDAALLDQNSLDFMLAVIIYLGDLKKQFTNLQKDFLARGLDVSQIDKACACFRSIDLDLQTRKQQHHQAVINLVRIRKIERIRARTAAAKL